MSVWKDIHDRSNGKTVRREDLIEDLKKKIKVAAKEYVEAYIDAMFESEHTVEEIQNLYEWAFMDDNTEFVVKRMEEADQDNFWEFDEEYNLSDYTYAILKKTADKMVSALEEEITE